MLRILNMFLQKKVVKENNFSRKKEGNGGKIRDVLYTSIIIFQKNRSFHSTSKVRVGENSLY